VVKIMLGLMEKMAEDNLDAKRGCGISAECV
jgi:hypothetical protein